MFFTSGEFCYKTFVFHNFCPTTFPILPFLELSLSYTQAPQTDLLICLPFLSICFPWFICSFFSRFLHFNPQLIFAVIFLISKNSFYCFDSPSPLQTHIFKFFCSSCILFQALGIFVYLSEDKIHSFSVYCHCFLYSLCLFWSLLYWRTSSNVWSS